MKYFHAIYKLDNNRYIVDRIRYDLSTVDLSWGNDNIHFNDIELIEVTKNEWLNSELVVPYSKDVDGYLRTDLNGGDKMNTKLDDARYNTDKTNKSIEELQDVGLINTEDISDGYHTFGQLYHDRTVLFAVLLNTYSQHGWKSKLHDDGTMYDDMFIAGTYTPQGMFTYHCDMKYWDLFEVEELSNAPKWDGHTFEDINRLFGLVNKGDF